MSQVGALGSGGSSGDEILTITGNTGGAVGPDGSGNINVVGTGSITIAGNAGTNTETVQLTGLTNHSLLVGAGTATITNLGVATNGQLPIGSTGADPVLATITAGANSSVTNGAGSITIKSNPRVSSAASIASPLSVNTNNFDMYVATAQSNDLTINADSGSPADGQKLVFRFLDDGSPRALTWASGTSGSYQAIGITLPTTTTTSKILYVGFIYDANAARWDGVATVVQS